VEDVGCADGESRCGREAVGELLYLRCGWEFVAWGAWGLHAGCMGCMRIACESTNAHDACMRIDSR